MLEILSQALQKQAIVADTYCSSNHSSSSSSPKSLTFINPEDRKEKSQLCRSYMETGFCPYQKRCKFAHGSHQLLKNHQVNMKYKTKQCDNYKKNLCCLYGNRCNFIHSHSFIPETTLETKNDVLLRLVKTNTWRNSRLMHLLERSQI